MCLERWLEKASKETKEWLKKENRFLKKTIKPNSIVLDVGCGTGRNLKAIAHLCKEAIGIDKNKKILEMAKENLKEFPKIKLVLGNAACLPFPNSYFDFIICMGNTFGMIKNKFQALEEMAKVTKQGGKIIISVYNEKALNTRVKDYKIVGHHIIKIDEKKGMIWTKEGLVSKQFTRKELETMFHKLNLKYKTINYKIINFTPISYLCEVSK